TNSATLDISPFQPAVLMQDVANSMDVLAAQKGLKLETYLDPQLSTDISGDRLKLQQILFNLAGNAIKFTEEGTVSIRFEAVDTEQWCIIVLDTGEGIPVGVQKHIFTAFWQVDGSPTRTVNRGVGLGLSIVKQLVDLMRGEIVIDSAPGQGSTFKITLPYDLERVLS
ncbi:MAG: sensor histidine kinase, partial [Aggregatilineales bacterium]